MTTLSNTNIERLQRTVADMRQQANDRRRAATHLPTEQAAHLISDAVMIEHWAAQIAYDIGWI